MTEMIALGPFQVDVDHGRLLRDGVERNLRPQAFRALKVLIQSYGEMVDYGQLARKAWDVNVSRHTVASTINEIKHVLEEYGCWITCRPKVGYRLEIHRSDDLIRRGWHFRNQYTRIGFENALRCFHQATDEDWGDFRTFEAIANTSLLLAGFLMRAPSQMRSSFVRAHSSAALLCGPTLTLRMDRAFALFVFERKLTEAESELVALQSEMPHCVHIYVRRALIRLASGDIAGARSLMPQARASDPLAPELALLEIVLRLFSGEFDAAVTWGKQAVDLHPGSQIARAFYAEALDFAGHAAEATEQYRLAADMSQDASWIRADQARSFAIHGAFNEAVKILADLESRREAEYVDAYHLALLLDALGRRDEAFGELERACQESSYSLLFSVCDPKAAALRCDPRFEGVRKRATRQAPAVLAAVCSSASG
jgi:DNA-binding winged helix-turn-helix (wHTH) protein/tetratricopeptide (TPR) repeat protein